MVSTRSHRACTQERKSGGISSKSNSATFTTGSSCAQLRNWEIQSALVAILLACRRSSKRACQASQLAQSSSMLNALANRVSTGSTCQRNRVLRAWAARLAAAAVCSRLY